LATIFVQSPFDSMGGVLVKQHLSTTALAVAAAICLAVNSAHVEAASPESFVASDDPGVAPDSNGNTADAWTVSTVIPPGAGGAGSFFGFGDSWALFSYPDGAEAGSAFADHTFAGGALGIGDMVSIRWANRAIQGGSSVGASLMSGGTPAVTVRYLGQNPVDTYLYDDAGGSGQAVGQTFMYETLTPFTFQLTSATTYSASFNGVPWSGTLSGPIDGIRMFNAAGGNGSDVFFNDLTITPAPEPSCVALALLVGICAAPGRRKTR
jgi:hypothetical protein